MLVETVDMRGQVVKDRRNTEEVIYKAVEAAAREDVSARSVIAIQHEATFIRFATNIIIAAGMWARTFQH